ncbi:DUF885 domain-containing protein [Leptospira wolffii]|uniref:DUF885 domain-containing protein n=1 Tax=Leptospira wolffii TaxID=409998 RepID=UPI001083A296|nr:DUF885 domain-containing protein [Leptospira wolffii]TGK61826.1 DUF885 domain-containing protein [Leptospira wolffii]TGK65913.1 DUF885 domain-containing protein [Leptospira wolffii]TGK74790.1 DUF885 domain-containing protein [Leptospira wolffii]TGL30856.1 DUF885 domain-containing protein [Leptospira wolffii]
MLKRTIRTLIYSLPVFILVFAFIVWHTIYFRPFTLGLYYEKIFWENILDDPETLTSLRILDSWGIRSHNRKWSDSSPEKEMERADKAKRQLEVLRSYDPSNLNDQDRIYYRAIEWDLSMAAEGEKYIYHYYPVNQLFGVQNHIPSFLASLHIVADKEDADAYISRLNGISVKIDQVLKGLEIREEQGVVPPDFILKRVIEELQNFRVKNPEENLLYKSFLKKLDKTDEITAEDKKTYLEETKKIISESIYPAYSKLESFLDRQKKQTNDKAGVWKLPDGDGFYAHVLKYHTTTSLSPEEVHTIGLSEVSRIQAEMRSIFESVGIKGGSIPNVMQELRKKPEFQFPDKPESKDEVIQTYKKILTDSIEKSKPLFPEWPRAKVEVERVPEFKQAGSAGAYYEEPSLDGKRPGVFYANLRDLKEIPKFGMNTLTYHESIPGHHLQIAWSQELTSAPRKLRTTHFTAFVEGWALYAERLAKDYDYYSDPYIDLGRLQAELFRAVRLVVDTGIHYKRWSRDQAIRYMGENTGMGPKEVTSEIERYIVYPGQACSYKIGMMSFLKMREEWKAAKGNAFDIKEYHGFVLGKGSLPLEILEAASKETLNR